MPTKLRHSSDRNLTARLLSLDEESLWFRDEGEAEEGEHLATAIVDQIDFEVIFDKNKMMKREEILSACLAYGYDCSPKTLDRAIKQGIANGRLKKEERGLFTIVRET